MAWMSQSAAARAEGVTRQWVHELVKTERVAANSKGQVRLEDVRRVRSEGLDPSRGHHKGRSRGSADSYADIRKDRESAQAELTWLEVRERAGELVEAAAVKKELAEKVVLLRESLLAIPERLAAMLAAESDEAKVRAAIDTEIRHALAGFAATVGASGKH